jgi:integrase
MANIEKRVSESGGASYRVKVRLKGYPSQSATFERLTDAKRWVQDTEAAMRDGRHFKTTEAKRHTLRELITRYLRDVMPSKPKSAKDQTRQLEWWKARLGSYALADVTPSLLAEYRDKLASGMLSDGSMTRQVKQPNGKTKAVPVEPRLPATIARYLAAISHAFTIAVKEWAWLESNPMMRVTKPKQPQGRVRFLSDEEREALLRECKASDHPDLYLAVVLALSTGARRMELLGLRWDRVDLIRKVITLYETKNGEIRALPLVSHAHELMKERAKVRRIDTTLVFPGTNPDKPVLLRSPFDKALARAGILNFHWHDLRHSCASYLAMNGASLAEIAEVLGHKTLQMVKRYAHLSHAHTSKVVERMNQRIFG